MTLAHISRIEHAHKIEHDILATKSRDIEGHYEYLLIHCALRHNLRVENYRKIIDLNTEHDEAHEPRVLTPVCQIPDCGCTGDAHP